MSVIRSSSSTLRDKALEQRKEPPPPLIPQKMTCVKHSQRAATLGLFQTSFYFRTELNSTLTRQ